MRKLYLSLLSLGTAAQVCALPANPPSAIKEEQLSAIQQHIKFSEYFIRWQDQAAAYQSPNRQQGLQTTYTNRELQITPVWQGKGCSFGLTIKGIAAKGKLVYQPVNTPVISNAENVIRFDHDKRFTVEYINSNAGVRQNFIVNRPFPVLHSSAYNCMLQMAGASCRPVITVLPLSRVYNRCTMTP